MPAGDARIRLEGLPPHVWAVAAILMASLLYAIFEVGVVRVGMPATHPAASMPGVLLSRPPAIDAGDPSGAERLGEWRRNYWQRRSEPRGDGWVRAHLPRILQVVVFIGAAIVLFFLRSNDLTAALSVLALALSGVAAGGPLFGVEGSVPFGRGLTLFAWLAGPFAFPIIALAILYFPTPSPWLTKIRALHVLPFAAAAPMIAGGAMTSLYLVGVDAAREAALWDASHASVFYSSFIAALGINMAAVVEGVHRYRFNHDANERRRIRMALYTGAPGVLAYAVKDGVPIAAQLAGAAPVIWPGPVAVVLQILVLLPAIGLVYAVGVARVLGPRIVLRRSLQYALANRTLTILTLLPAGALVISLARNPDARIRDLPTSLSLVLLAVSIGALIYRERARRWLDEHFFRKEYDARKILVSLASRVRFETDPSDLAAMIVTQVDEALNPELIAILASGIEENQLMPVTSLHGSVPALPLNAGLVSMLKWSEEPLEVFIHDPRSPVRRLPAEEQAWLERTRAVLLVPINAQDAALVGAIVLGERKSEEAYTAEDRQLLASIAAQVGLGFDVARLRRQLEKPAEAGSHTTHIVSPSLRPMMECPRCGRCDDPEVAICPVDGAPMRASLSIPRVLDGKYRLEQLLGRGGMGAVYRGRDMRLDRLVAVKVVRVELLGDGDARRRFKREAQIVARLQHPAIVAVYDYGSLPDSSAYLVMELIKGEDLRHALVREGRLEPSRATRILTTVCGAIEAAHRQGVLHRDLKPENILLPGDGTEAKVLDFGVAKIVDRDEGNPGPAESQTVLTVEGTIVGTPAYMAPEQLRGLVPDARTDVFSLGVIAYEMLTGRLPFGRGSLAEVILAQSRGVPQDGIDALPPALARAIRMALEPDPDRRPPSPQAFAHLSGAAGGM